MMSSPALRVLPLAAAILLSATALGGPQADIDRPPLWAEPGPTPPRLRPHARLAAPLSGPFSVTRTGQLYVSDGRRVHRVGTDGKVRASWALSGPSQHGALWTGTGLWAVSDAGEVQRFTPDGHEVLRVDVGGVVVAHPRAGSAESLLVAHGGSLERLGADGQRRILLSLEDRIGGLSPLTDGALAVATHGGRVCVVEESDHAAFECVRLPHRFDGPPLLTSKRVIAGADGGHVLTLDRAPLKPRLAQRVDGHVRSGMTRSGPRLLLQTFGPRPALLSLDPQTGRVLRATPLGLLDDGAQGARGEPTEVAKGHFLTLGPRDAALLSDEFGRVQVSLPLPGAEHGHIARSAGGHVYVGAGRSVYRLEL